MKRFPMFASLIAAILFLAAPAGNTISVQSPTVTNVRAAAHPGYDRVVFDFKGGLPEQRSVNYVSQCISDAKGDVIPLPGTAIVRIRFFHGVAHTDAGQSTIQNSYTFGLPNVIKVVKAGDFEGVLSFCVALRDRHTVDLFTLTNNRVVVDIGTPPLPRSPAASAVTKVPTFTG